VNSPTTVNITVSRGQVSLTQTLQLLPFIEAQNLTVSPTSIQGGGRVTATIALNAEAFGNGQAVSLASSNDAVATFGRGSITVAAGQIGTTLLVLTHAVNSNTQVTLSATAGGTTRTTTLTVTP
jgi:hypothetical protein